MTDTFNCQDLITIFNTCFNKTERTRLVGGADEPFYQPALNATELHCIEFTHDYYSSALHEIAHWCIAGPKRRLLPDYGYWYEPDGRSLSQQLAFEQVEIKPQALEWLFHGAVGKRFHISADNLVENTGPSPAFCDDIHAQVHRYFEQGIPTRAQCFIDALLAHYKRQTAFTPALFQRPLLG